MRVSVLKIIGRITSDVVSLRASRKQKRKYVAILFWTHPHCELRSAINDIHVVAGVAVLYCGRPSPRSAQHKRTSPWRSASLCPGHSFCRWRHTNKHRLVQPPCRNCRVAQVSMYPPVHRDLGCLSLYVSAHMLCTLDGSAHRPLEEYIVLKIARRPRGHPSESAILGTPLGRITTTSAKRTTVLRQRQDMEFGHCSGSDTSIVRSLQQDLLRHIG